MGSPLATFRRAMRRHEKRAAAAGPLGLGSTSVVLLAWTSDPPPESWARDAASWARMRGAGIYDDPRLYRTSWFLLSRAADAVAKLRGAHG